MIRLREGENATVNISLKANPKVNNLIWRKISNNGKEKDLPLSRMKTDGLLLYITNISKNDNGQYSCLASNVVGESKVLFNFNVECK